MFLLIQKLGELTLTGVGAPIESGFRQMPGTLFIMYAAFQSTKIGIIEHVVATSPFVFLRSLQVTTYDATGSTMVTDIRPVVENGIIKYLIVAYVGYSGAIGTPTIENYSFKVWGPPANNPTPTAIACGSNSISGCKTCGTGARMDVNKCETCADGQGNLLS